MKMRTVLLKILCLAVILHLTSSVSAFSRELVVVLDVSSDMAQTSLDSGKSALALAVDNARYLVDSELTKYPDSTISLIGFSQKASLLYKGKGDSSDLAVQFDSLAVQDMPGSLEAGITESVNLLEQYISEEDDNYIVIYTAGGKDTSVGLLRTLEQATAGNIKIWLKLFSEETCEYLPETTLPEDQILTISTYCYSGQELANDAFKALFLTVRQKTAEYLGIKEDVIYWETDLVGELGVDTFAAYELLSQLCDNFKIALPPQKDLSIVGEIVQYIAEAQKGRTTKGTTSVTEKAYQVSVHYATDRKTTGKDDPDSFYGPERSDNNQVFYGTCKVSIPVGHQKGRIEEPFWGLKFLESSDQHIVLAKIEPLDKESFFESFISHEGVSGADSTADDILLFVHGFNQSFASAAKRTAQIAFDLNFQGIPFMFSWPSNNNLFDYWADREDVIWSVAHLESVLMDLKEKVPGRKIHLIAHSMGNQALIGALNRIGLQYRGDDKNHLFENIILAAPDFDAQLFEEQIAPDVRHLAKNWTIYTSDNDAALSYSADINNTKRLGTPLPEIDGVNVIDATGVEVTPWNVPEFHSYYATKMIVIKDMIAILKGVAPDARGLVPSSKSRFLWIIKKQVEIMNSSQSEDNPELY